MVAIRQEINLTNITADPVDSVEAIYGAGGYVYFDSADYNGATFYVEIVAKNSSGSSTASFRIYEHSSSGHVASTTLAVYEIPINTNIWTLFRTNSVTPNNLYKYKFFAVDAVDDTIASIKSAKIIILQDATDITDTQTQIEIGSYMAKASSPSEDVYMGVDEPKYWKYESAKWDPTPTFKFGITVANETAGKTNNVGIQEDDGAGGWTATPVITITGISSEDTTYYESSSFTPTNGKIYRLAWMTPNDKYALTIYNAKVIATQPYGYEADEYLLSMYSGHYEQLSQSFKSGAAFDLDWCKFNLRKTGSPTGNAYAKIYAHTGTFGTSSEPTGSALATSDAFDVSTLTTSYNWIQFNFSTPATLSLNTNYCIVIEFTGGNSSNKVETRHDLSIGGVDHEGNLAWANDAASPTYSTGSNDDLSFKLGNGNGTITKLQPEYLLINEAQTATGLQKFMTDWDPAEWDGVANDYFHEHSANSASSNTKLQEDPGGTPADITNSNITGNNLTRGGSAMTMPATAKEIDSYIVTA